MIEGNVSTGSQFCTRCREKCTFFTEHMSRCTKCKKCREICTFIFGTQNSTHVRNSNIKKLNNKNV